MRTKLVQLALMGVFACVSAGAHAGAYCAVEVPNFDGIGDGCTTLGTQYVLPDIGMFRSTFTPACQAHDRCYANVGGSYGLCNGKFLSDMRNACSSAFNRWLQPIEYYTCRDTAERYYLAVEAWRGTKDPLFSGGMLSDALRRSRNLELLVNMGACGTAPEATGLYTPEVITEVNARFSSTTGRAPTIVEFLRAANLAGGSDGVPLASRDFNAWSQEVQNLAYQAVSAPAPNMAFAVNGSTFAVSAPTAGVNYGWRLFNSNGSDGYTYVGGNSHTYPLPISTDWSYYITVPGLLEARHPTTFKLLDSRPFTQRLLVSGPCGRYSAKMASIIDCDY